MGVSISLKIASFISHLVEKIHGTLPLPAPTPRFESQHPPRHDQLSKVNAHRCWWRNAHQPHWWLHHEDCLSANSWTKPRVANCRDSESHSVEIRYCRLSIILILYSLCCHRLCASVTQISIPEHPFGEFERQRFAKESNGFFLVFFLSRSLSLSRLVLCTKQNHTTTLFTMPSKCSTLSHAVFFQVNNFSVSLLLLAFYCLQRVVEAGSGSGKVDGKMKNYKIKCNKASQIELKNVTWNAWNGIGEDESDLTGR